MNIIQIRKATKNDIEQWSHMRTALWPDTSDDHLSEINAYFADKSIDIAEVYIAEIDTQSIGFIELNIRNFSDRVSSALITNTHKPHHTRN